MILYWCVLCDNSEFVIFKSEKMIRFRGNIICKDCIKEIKEREVKNEKI